MDFLTLTTTCCQIDLDKLFTGGFCTGHGFLREPNDIASYSALACIAIQSNQNDQHGGQSIPNFDYAHGQGRGQDLPQAVTVTNMGKALELLMRPGGCGRLATRLQEELPRGRQGLVPSLAQDNGYRHAEAAG